MKVIGLLSGTSYDAVDAVALALSAEDGGLHGSLLAASTTPYPQDVRGLLASALPPASVGLDVVCRLDTRIGQVFAEVAAELASRVGGADLVSSHGQTVYHWVEGNRALGTVQLGQPAWIAARTGLPVVADVRIRDIVAGGQGAPLVSHLDTLLLADAGLRPAALNLGGIANVTVLHGSGGQPVAFDTGPANALLDAAVVEATGGARSFDAGGRLAAGGVVQDALLVDLLAEPYYALAVPKSTGKELYHGGYLRPHLDRHPGLALPDVLATLVALTAETVARAVRPYDVDVLVASGGGVRNPALMAALAQRMPGVRIDTTDRYGAPSDLKEAIAFAVIGWHTWHGLPAVVPSCTGAGAASVLGAITPGRAPLRLPEPPAVRPVRLHLEAGAGAEVGS